jgi:hypothetical protein
VDDLALGRATYRSRCHIHYETRDRWMLSIPYVEGI